MINLKSHSKTIQSIIEINKKLEVFWKNSNGWASDSTAKFISVARLDWQSSLSRTLSIYLDAGVRKEEGGLILAWVNLGALVEGTMKLFFSVFLEDYQNELKRHDGMKNIVKNG